MSRDRTTTGLEDVPRADVQRLFRDAARPPLSENLRAQGRDVAHKIAQVAGGKLVSGDEVGPYVVLETIGQGGQATVYLASHRETDRRVALKIPKHEIAVRLGREAQILFYLDHPHIVRIEKANLDTELPYIATEHLPGGNLAELIRERAGRPIPLEQIYAIAHAVLDALDYAHRNGVVHRDIKPANILFDAHGVVKVADFGIGKLSLAPEGRPQTGSASVATVVVGTPAYMAPEQEDPALREGGRIDGRADLFSLGKVLYEAMTGFSPRTIRPVSRTRDDVDSAWDDLIFRLVEEAPDERFADAQEAKQALADLDPKDPHTRSVAGSARKSWRRRRSVTRTADHLRAFKADLGPAVPLAGDESAAQQPLFDRVLDRAIRLVNGERGILFLMEGAQPRMQVARSLRGEIELPTLTNLPLDLIRRAADERRSEASLHATSNFDATGLMGSLEVRSFCCAPLATDERKYGVIYVDRPVSRGPDDRYEMFVSVDDREGLAELARGTALALENPKLFNTLLTSTPQSAPGPQAPPPTVLVPKPSGDDTRAPTAPGIPVPQLGTQRVPAALLVAGAAIVAIAATLTATLAGGAWPRWAHLLVLAAGFGIAGPLAFQAGVLFCDPLRRR